MIVTGHSIQVTVRRGCLCIKSDGTEQRIERVPKIHDRLIINGTIGLITLEAMAWMDDYGLPWSVLYRGHGIIAANVSGQGDPEVWRNQVTGDPLPVTRLLIAAKLRGQAANCELLRAPDVAKRLYGYADRIMLRDDLTAITGQEGRGSSQYWDVWRAAVAVPWLADHMLRVPPRWLGFGGRTALGGAQVSNRHATDPVNALLNYAYRVGETLASEACSEAGLSPVLGLGHNRRHTRKRDGDVPRPSMALDLLEVIRPGCDRVVLGLLDYGQGIRGYLRWTDFLELESGVVRVESETLRGRIIRECQELSGVVRGYAGEVKELLS